MEIRLYLIFVMEKSTELRFQHNWRISYLLSALLWCSLTYAQQKVVERTIFFSFASAKLDTAYRNNSVSLADMISDLTPFANLNPNSSNKQQARIIGMASPEGNHLYNQKLAHLRAKALETFLRKNLSLPADYFSVSDSIVPLKFTLSKITNSDWRCAKLIIFHPSTLQSIASESHTYNLEEDVIHTPIETKNLSLINYEANAPLPVVRLAKRKRERMSYLKTNLTAWGLLVANIAFEYNLSQHCSLSLPLSFSAWDYFVSTRKFRTLAFYPELRFWPSGNEGLFFGLHAGIAYYNYAFGGKYRIQDHNTNTPALGGGVDAGYRLALDKKLKWLMEFSLGAGGYHLDYNRLYNRPNGFLIDRKRKTWWGIDQINISLVHQIDWNKVKQAIKRKL